MKPKTLQDFERHVEQTATGQSKLKKQQAAIGELQQTISQFARQNKNIKLEMPSDRDRIRFALFGDTQFGNLYERPAYLKNFYKIAVDRGVTKFFHTGDVLDGHKVYRGQEFELHKHGFSQQAAWFAEQAPAHKGVETYFITGNHDHSIKSAAGINVGEGLEQLRPDWKFLGEDQGDLTLATESGREFRLMLIHPGGGSAYSLSYRPQKLIESLSGGSKPHLLAIGHYHKAELLPNYRNVVGCQTGTFQAQTPFMKRGGLAAHMGGWIFEVNVGDLDSLSNAFTQTFIAYY